MSPGYAIIDVETTGLHPGHHHRVIELAIVQVDSDGAVAGEWCSLVNPQRDLGPQGIHGITAAEVRRAPVFAELAGDIAERLAGRVLVAHNLSFDSRFLQAEFQRAGVDIDVSYRSGLCTMHLATTFLPQASRSLAACSRAAAIPLEHAHSALHDAYAAAGLMTFYLQTAGCPPPWHQRLVEAARISWPALPTGIAAPVRRRSAHEQEPDFLTRLVDRLPSVPLDPRTDDYLAVLDSALIDRLLSESEKDELLDTASDLGLTLEDVLDLHRRYLAALAGLAWSDGVLSDDERTDLQLTAELLSLSNADAEGALAAARTQEEVLGHQNSHTDWGRFALAPGDLVVFTGEMALPREEWRTRAAAAGLKVNGGSVTKATRLVVAADPDSLSGKARKARDYKIPVVNESVFAELLAALYRGGC